LEKSSNGPSNSFQTVIKSVISQPTKRFYEFDRFRIDLTERALLYEEELMAKVWPDTHCRGE